MNLSSFSLGNFSELALSDQPQERDAQARIVAGVVRLVQRSAVGEAGRGARRDLLTQLAQTPLVEAVTEEMYRSMPETDDFGSFAELAARRDETGVVRLKR